MLMVEGSPLGYLFTECMGAYHVSIGVNKVVVARIFSKPALTDDGLDQIVLGVQILKSSPIFQIFQRCLGFLN